MPLDPALIGQIQLVPFPSAPQSWILCQGQTIPTAQEPALYTILGNIFGGNSQAETFALPNLSQVRLC